MQAHRPSIFIFFIGTAGSHELEKDVVKKKIKNYGKVERKKTGFGHVMKKRRGTQRGPRT
jgi:hypothetical protein